MRAKFGWLAALLLLCVLAACSAPDPVSCELEAQASPVPVALPEGKQGEWGSAPLQESRAEAPRYLADGKEADREAEQYIYACLMAEQAEIDLSAYKVAADRITPLYTNVMNRYPELFFVEADISYTYTSAGKVVTLTPSYRITGEALEQARADYEQLLDEICRDVDESWSDFEIALYLHDYLCLHFSYDTTYQIFDAYRFLTEGKGVCQAYTLTYAALLQRFGIQSDVAVSNAMNHIWNIIVLGGRAYHVDVTWDDPLPDLSGNALHANFLRSDGGIAQTDHYDWVSAYTCTSDVYESTFLVQVEQPFCYTSGQWLRADDEARTVFRADFSTMSQTAVLTVSDKWQTARPGRYYVDAFFGAGAYRGNLIYNTSKQIWAYNLQSGTTVEIKINLPRGMQIFGLWVDADTVYYRVSDSADGQMQTLQVCIAELANYLVGDADQNGVVDGRDVTAILRYLAGLPTLCHTGAADLDDSGEVDARDAQLLRQFIVENQ